MKKLIATTAALLFVSPVPPAQATDTCNTIIVSLCVGGSGLSLSSPQIIPPAPTTPAPTPETATGAAANTQPQATTPAPARSQEKPGAAPTAPKIETPGRAANQEAKPPTPESVNQGNTTTTAEPEVKTKIVTRYVKTPATWKLPVGILIAAMILAVLVMYVMYRLGTREAETKFNEYIIDVMRTARPRRKKSLISS